MASPPVRPYCEGGLPDWAGPQAPAGNNESMSATPPTPGMPATVAPHAGERPDFDALSQRHSREVWALVYARCMNSHTAMDIAQEAFLRYWRESEAGEPILNPRAWLLRVARNL